jgi:hypothetical protein
MVERLIEHICYFMIAAKMLGGWCSVVVGEFMTSTDLLKRSR